MKSKSDLIKSTVTIRRPKPKPSHIVITATLTEAELREYRNGLVGQGVPKLFYALDTGVRALDGTLPNGSNFVDQVVKEEVL